MAGIDVARGDDAVEGRRDRLVGLVGDVLFEGGLRLQHRGVGFIGGLLRDDACAQQGLVALVGDESEVVVGARVGDLLIELGRRKDGEQLALVDAVALVDLDRLQVAGDFCVNVGLVEAANGGGQFQIARGRSERNVGRPARADRPRFRCSSSDVWRPIHSSRASTRPAVATSATTMAMIHPAKKSLPGVGHAEVFRIVFHLGHTYYAPGRLIASISASR